MSTPINTFRYNRLPTVELIKIQKIIFFAESRFLCILKKISESDMEDQGWMQILLRRELVSVIFIFDRLTAQPPLSYLYHLSSGSLPRLACVSIFRSSLDRLLSTLRCAPNNNCLWSWVPIFSPHWMSAIIGEARLGKSFKCMPIHGGTFPKRTTSIPHLF